MIYRSRKSDAGFTLTEMAIVLGVVGVLVAGLWNLISGANQQARDESAANQQGQLIAAVKQFLTSQQGQAFMTTNAGCGGACGPFVDMKLPLPTSCTPANFAAPYTGDANLLQLCNVLPPGFNSATVNSYQQTYNIQIQRDGSALNSPPNSYTFMIIASGATPVPDTSGSRIAALIGGDGGFLYTNSVCGAPAATTACGSYGGWVVSTTGAFPGFGFAAGVSISGSVVSRTYVTPQLNALSDWLARIPMPGDTTFVLNTMTTPEYLGGQQLNMGSWSSPLASIGGGAFNLQNGTTNFAVPGVAVGGGVMNIQGGILAFGNYNAALGITTGAGTISGNMALDNNGVTVQAPDPSVSRTSGLTIAGNMVGLSNNPANFQKPNSALTVNGGCTRAIGAPFSFPPDPGTGDSQCQYTVGVNGDINVLGLLNAYNLFAGSFIYKGSDIRLKTDIHPLQDPLGDVMRLKPVSYRLKSNNQQSLGVIAQDLEKVYPQLVSTNAGTKYVDYDGLIGPLIGAVQELKKQNDQLQHEVDELKKQQKNAQ